MRYRLLLLTALPTVIVLGCLNSVPVWGAETKPADGKAVDNKPVEKKPAEKKPADKKSADKKPADKKPTDVKIKKPDNRNADKGYSILRMGPNGIPMPPDRTASAEARRTLDQAKARLTTALGTTSANSTFAIDNELMKSEDYRMAVLDLRRAQADYDNVRRPIFEMLRADTYYKELAKQQADSQRVIHQLVLTGRGSFDWLFPHAVAALNVRQRMTREEIIAMAQTPQIEDSRQMMLLAAAKVRSMRGTYIAQTTNNAQAGKEKVALDAGRNSVRQAQADYNAAVAEEALYERVRADYIEEFRRTGKAPVANAK